MSATSAAAFSFVERLAKDLEDQNLELPAFPEAVIRIQQALKDPETSGDDIVHILASEPALAARLLRIANSVAFRRADKEITDLRKAVARMGFNVIRSVSTAFAMRQLKRKDELKDVRPQIEAIWRESIEAAALCYVLAKSVRVNPDHAMLMGLLHVLGKLYIVMRAKELGYDIQTDVMAVISDWHGVITKAILESWGLPETMREAVEEQDHLDYESEDGQVNQTHVLIAARLLRLGQEHAPTDPSPALMHLGVDPSDYSEFLSRKEEEIAAVQSSLSA